MKTQRFILVLAILCFVLAVGVPAVASATLLPATGSSTNTDCLGCHEPGSTVTGTTVEFGVGAVNKATACQKCHWISPHPIHESTQRCNALCHGRWDWGTRTDFWVSQTTPDAVAVGSYFNSDESVNTSADELHRIHTRRSWIAELADYRPKCAGCHAAATCDACHGSGTEHGAHGVAGDPEVGEPTEVVLTNMTGGAPTSAISSDADFTFYGESGCIASGCHAGVASGYFIDDSEIDYTGDWNTVYNANLIGDSYRYSTQTTAVFQFTFTGTGFAWVGQSINTGGISDIYIDGIYKKSADSFLGRWGLDKHVASVLGLPYGEHTVTVKNTVRSSYLWNYIFVQGVRVYGAKPDFVAAPDCAGCHDQHGDLEAKHVSSWTLEGCTADGCHLTNELAAEHDQWQPTNTCALCHGTAVNTTVADAVDVGVTACDACHTTLLTESAHHDLHYAASVTQKGCSRCHSMYLDTEHANRGYDCNACHDPDEDNPLAAAAIAAVANGDLRCVACHGSMPHRTR
ncbi:MAG: hypothetical protein Q7J82_07155 [Coriobacteriia bacterium]|nr:hypothetical protein [Coriobacteriia bacterium]